MIQAFLWGAAAGSSLLAGGALALYLRPSRRIIGLVLAFGAGVLISAVAFELFLEAARTAERAHVVAIGLFAGSVTFFVGDLLIDRMGGERRRARS